MNAPYDLDYVTTSQWPKFGCVFSRRNLASESDTQYFQKNDPFCLPFSRDRNAETVPREIGWMKQLFSESPIQPGIATNKCLSRYYVFY